MLTLKQSKVPKDEIEGYISESERNLTWNPGFFFPHLMLLNLYTAKGQWSKAVEHGGFLISHRHKNFSIYMVMGLAYENLKNFDMAKNMYKNAKALNPKSKEADKGIERVEILKRSGLPSNT